MRRREFSDDDNDDDSLLEETQREQEVKRWNVFQNNPREGGIGSTEEYKIIDGSVKVLKVATILLIFGVVLGSAVISKLTLFLMTSQVKKNITRAYCNENLDIRRQFVVTIPEVERVEWIWFITFAYMIPEIGTFMRSIRVCFFKTWNYPTLFEFLALAVTESLPAIGSAILVFVVLPEMDVIKGAMLTNAVCFVPAIVSLFSRNPLQSKGNYFLLIMDILAIVAQASAFVVWPIVEDNPKLYAIAPAVIFISLGWWENFVSEKSPIPYLRTVARAKKDFDNKKYFTYAIVSVVKCVLFFISMLVIFYLTEGSVGFLFDNFLESFSAHPINVTEVTPIVGGTDISFDDGISVGPGKTIESKYLFSIVVCLSNIASTYICYAFGKFAIKVLIQGFGFAFPISLTVPVLLTVLIAMCGKYATNECAYDGYIPLYLFFNTLPLVSLNNFVSEQYPWIWLLWLLSQVWVTIHIWTYNTRKLAPTEKIFMRPLYDAFLIDQSIALNKRREAIENMSGRVEDTEDNDDSTRRYDSEDNTTRIIACGTMWHEERAEMLEFLKSILRMDQDQCTQRMVKTYLQKNLPSYYEFETHIFFDDAFIRQSKDDVDPHINSYVELLISVVEEAASKVHETTVRIRPPIKTPTPYGGRLTWTLPGKTKMIAHLKDKAKIRAKKRWSQVMYMYYLLGHRIMDNDQIDESRVATISENTYILALDGDIDFQPEAVHLLVDYMHRNRKTLGAACGRIHPIGGGAMAWYQVFEYAVGHWLQKATEHVIGCVLCSPGCFSLFRGKALMDHNVMAKYTTTSKEALHYVQYDQGEDRWLCTLLLQRGYRVEYSAASDAYTHCPEGFNEFYNQRRRWMPSTTANIMDLLMDAKYIIQINDNISRYYIWYQIILLIGTAIGPGSIFLMLVGAFVSAFKISQWVSFWWNIVPVVVFSVTCACFKSEFQLFIAGIISAIYGLVMMAVFVGIMMQIQEDGPLAPSSLFFFVLVAEFVIAALLHPKEFYCLKYGIIYYVTVPSMYLLLVIYSVFNMNNVSWGTRDATVVKPAANAEENAEQQKPEEKKPEQNKVLSFFGYNTDTAGSFEFSFAGIFKCLLCTYEKNGEEKEKLSSIQTSLQQIQQKLDWIERYQLSPESIEMPRKTMQKRKTTFVEGARASRPSGMPRPSEIKPNFVIPEDDDDDISIDTIPSDDVPKNSWFYDSELAKSEVVYLDRKEEKFWNELIDAYLFPINDKTKEVEDKLKNLRDKVVITFFMINSLYVLVVFLLTLQKDLIHLNWPFTPTMNFTFTNDNSINRIVINKTYLELEPIGFVFLIFFFSLMVIQFIAMIIHRFGTYSQIMANTDLDIELFETKLENLTEDELLEKDPVKIFRKLVKLKGVNEDDEDTEEPLNRRDTVHALALKKGKRSTRINFLDKAFEAQLEKIRKDGNKESRKTVAAIERRRTTILRRQSEMPQFGQNSSHMADNYSSNTSMTFDNPAFEAETIT